MELTRKDRLFLVNQYKILEKLDPELSDYYSKTIEILENGYEYLYDFGIEHIHDGSDVMSEAECKEVWETMDMFDSIDRSLQDIPEADIDRTFASFKGYDGNREGKFLGFSEFTVNRDKRFTYLKLPKENYFNSHMPMRDIYARMLAEWRKIPPAQRYQMRKEKITSILDAAIHPDNRGRAS